MLRDVEGMRRAVDGMLRDVEGMLRDVDGMLRDVETGKGDKIMIKTTEMCSFCVVVSRGFGSVAVFAVFSSQLVSTKQFNI